MARTNAYASEAMAKDFYSKNPSTTWHASRAALDPTEEAGVHRRQGQVGESVTKGSIAAADPRSN